MDRRQKKSREAIFQAFTRLLSQKHFNNITVQEIIDEANVGRTTFYAHFETKDVLLKELCSELFHHVFSHDLGQEPSHDFSISDQKLRDRLTHIIYHLRDNEGNLLKLMTTDSGQLFTRFFNEEMEKVFVLYPSCLNKDVPKAYALSFVVKSFSEMICIWVKTGQKESPEDLVELYLKLINNKE